ncbi:MAG: hypothetical protein ABI600_05130 [Luteolibacter sp.]
MRDALDGISLALIDGLDRMREDAEIVRRSDTDAGVAMIDAECGVRGG